MFREPKMVVVKEREWMFGDAMCSERSNVSSIICHPSPHQFFVHSNWRPNGHPRSAQHSHSLPGTPRTRRL